MRRKRSIKFIVLILIIVFVAFPSYADLVDELEELVGYTIIDSKTIDSWYDEDESDDSFEGCSHGRVIVFDDGTKLTCAEYGYQYAYRPTAVILVNKVTYQDKTFYEYKMIVGDEVYDMRR
jgi:hypothetical protein